MRRLAMRRFRQTVVSCEEAQIASILDAVNRGIPAPLAGRFAGFGTGFSPALLRDLPTGQFCPGDRYSVSQARARGGVPPGMGRRLFCSARKLCPILCLLPAYSTCSEVIRAWSQPAPDPHEYCVVTLRNTLVSC